MQVYQSFALLWVYFVVVVVFSKEHQNPKVKQEVRKLAEQELMRPVCARDGESSCPAG